MTKYEELSENTKEGYMKLKDILERLSNPQICRIELRNESNFEILNCPATSSALEPYADRPVTAWMPHSFLETSDFIVLIDTEEVKNDSE